MAVVFLAFMVTIAFFQVPSTLKRGKRNELVAFGVIWTVATLYGLLVIIGVRVPKPAMLIVEFFEKVEGISIPIRRIYQSCRDLPKRGG